LITRNLARLPDLIAYGANCWNRNVMRLLRRRLRRGLLAAPKEDVASPAFVPLTVDDDLQRYASL
jgi:hypothetical protein